MGSDKQDVRDELKRMVDEYLKDGGKIEQIPVGVTGDGVRFHSSTGSKAKFKLYGLSQKNKKKKAGFHTQRIKLKQF